MCKHKVFPGMIKDKHWKKKINVWGGKCRWTDYGCEWQVVDRWGTAETEKKQPVKPESW